MPNGIFTIQTRGIEVKGKEVLVNEDGVLNEETGEIVKFSDLFKSFIGQYINFSIKVAEKDEEEFKPSKVNED